MLTIYGASTSVLLLLLFVFYSSFMFYYGACFTQSLADHTKRPILPKANAMRYVVERMELDENGQRIPVKKV
jgi:membrane protein